MKQIDQRTLDQLKIYLAEATKQLIHLDNLIREMEAELE